MHPKRVGRTKRIIISFFFVVGRSPVHYERVRVITSQTVIVKPFFFGVRRVARYSFFRCPRFPFDIGTFLCSSRHRITRSARENIYERDTSHHSRYNYACSKRAIKPAQAAVPASTRASIDRHLGVRALNIPFG